MIMLNWFVDQYYQFKFCHLFTIYNLLKLTKLLVNITILEI